jgi:hypothetical protein
MEEEITDERSEGTRVVRIPEPEKDSREITNPAQASASRNFGIRIVWEPVGFTAKRLQDSAQGGGFAKPWVNAPIAVRPEGPIEIGHLKERQTIRTRVLNLLPL